MKPIRLLCLVAMLCGSAWAEGDTGTIAGTVRLGLPQRGQQPVRYYRGPFRAAAKKPPAASPIRSIVIYVDKVPPPASAPGGWPVPSEPAFMRQHHDRFEPHVLPVMRGRTVSFPNDDDYFHNVFSVVAGDRFDLGRYGQGDTRLQSFTDPAVVVVRCEIHPGMKAFIIVRDNPLFTIPDDEGQYAIEGVPPGTWAVHAWHPTQGVRPMTVTVESGATTRLDVAF